MSQSHTHTECHDCTHVRHPEESDRDREGCWCRGLGRGQSRKTEKFSRWGLLMFVQYEYR